METPLLVVSSPSYFEVELGRYPYILFFPSTHVDHRKQALDEVDCKVGVLEKGLDPHSMMADINTKVRKAHCGVRKCDDVPLRGYKI